MFMRGGEVSIFFAFRPSSCPPPPPRRTRVRRVESPPRADPDERVESLGAVVKVRASTNDRAQSLLRHATVDTSRHWRVASGDADDKVQGDRTLENRGTVHCRPGVYLYLDKHKLTLMDVTESAAAGLRASKAVLHASSTA
jgi:hypothetical protein